MRLIPDQNRCCTAICLDQFRSPVNHSYYRDVGLSHYDRWGNGSYDDDFDVFSYPHDTYDNFELALALLRKNYADYTSGLSSIYEEVRSHPSTVYDRGEEVDFFSTIFCFTSTGGASDNLEDVEEYLERFGFVGSEGRSSEKYKGESIVRLWSISVEDFCRKCDTIIGSIKDGHYGAVTIPKEAAA